VHDQPQEPPGEAPHAQPAALADCVVARDGGKAPEIPVAKRPRLRVLPVEPSANLRGRMAAGLHGALGQPGEVVERHEIADHEHLPMAGERAVGEDGDLARRGQVGAAPPRQQRAERRPLDTGGPHLGPRRHAARLAVAPTDLDAFCIDSGHQRTDLNLHAHPLELACRLPGRALVEGPENPGRTVEQEDAGVSRIDAAEV
jgi:hypothetical protein